MKPQNALTSVKWSIASTSDGITCGDAYHESLEVEFVRGGILVHDTNSVDKSGHVYPTI